MADMFDPRLLGLQSVDPFDDTAAYQPDYTVNIMGQRIPVDPNTMSEGLPAVNPNAPAPAPAAPAPAQPSATPPEVAQKVAALKAGSPSAPAPAAPAAPAGPDYSQLLGGPTPDSGAANPLKDPKFWGKALIGIGEIFKGKEGKPVEAANAFEDRQKKLAMMDEAKKQKLASAHMLIPYIKKAMPGLPVDKLSDDQLIGLTDKVSDLLGLKKTEAETDMYKAHADYYRNEPARQAAKTEKEDAKLKVAYDKEDRTLEINVGNQLRNVVRTGMQTPRAQAMQNLYQTEKGMALLKKIQQGGLTATDAIETETATDLARILGGGEASQYIVQHLTSKNLPKTVGGVLSFVTGIPMKQMTDEVLKQQLHQFEQIRATSMNQLSRDISTALAQLENSTHGDPKAAVDRVVRMMKREYPQLDWKAIVEGTVPDAISAMEKPSGDGGAMTQDAFTSKWGL